MRAGSISQLYESLRVLSKCLASLPCFLLNFSSLSFCLFIFSYPASNPLQPPTIPLCLCLALPHFCSVLIFRPPPILLSLQGIFLLSWNRCPFINKDLVYHSNEGMSRHAQKGERERRSMIERERGREIIFNMHVCVCVLCYKPEHVALYHNPLPFFSL